MLDIMRRRKGFVKIVLGAVVISVAASFAFALYGIWGGALSQTDQGSPDWIAVVDGEQIPTGRFQRQRGLLLQQYREQFLGQGFDEETLSALVDQQALGALLGTHLARNEAARAGLRVTPREISDKVVIDFSPQGRFVGADQYRKILRSNGMEPAQYERQVGESLAAEKLRQAVASLARVDEADVERRFRDEVERVDVNYVLLADSAYADAKAPGEAELRAHFQSHAPEYMTPEQRRALFVLFDREAKAASIQIPEEDLRSAYERDKAALYSHGEQRRASHILVKLDPAAGPEKEAEARAKAAEAAARVRAGEEFAAVAREVSEDPGSASNGGDLGFFERGRMVREFEDPAFSLAVGVVSEPIKSPFGFHVLKVTDSRPAGVQPFEEVRDEIRRSLAVRKAQEEIRKEADAFVARLATQESDFAKTAAAMGLTAADTGLFAKGEPAGSLGRLPQVDQALFGLGPGGSTQPITVPQGLAVLALAEVKPPEPAPFDSVKARVEADLKRSRTRERARKAAAEILAGSGALAERAGRHKLEVKIYAAVNRIQPLPPLTDASKSAAFAASPGAVLGPFEADDGLVVLEVTGKKPATAEEETAERAALRARLLAEERNALFQVFLNQFQKNARIEINQALLDRGRPRG